MEDSECKVIVNMACGLANRMFQYAYYIYLKKLGYNACVDYFNTAVLAHEDVAWNRIFPNASFIEASKEDIDRMGGARDKISRLRRKILPFTTKVTEMDGAFDITLPPRNKERYMLGVFQSAEVVDSVSDEIKKAYVFPEFESKTNCDLKIILRGQNSVGIHVRKGKDYQRTKWYKNTCSVDYYKRAVDRIIRDVESPVFYVFTDNPGWVKENFTWLDYKLVEGNPGSGWGSHCDMQLMSLCKHNIISNSTYSWWGAYLNENPDKIVICPEVWFDPHSTSEYSSKKLLAKGWIAL